MLRLFKVTFIHLVQLTSYNSLARLVLLQIQLH